MDSAWARWGWMVVVSLMWGGTNPLLKRGCVGVDDVTGYTWLPGGATGGVSVWAAQTVFLFTTPSYILPFAVNQSASAVFLYSLGSAPLSVAVPVTNALTFALTAAVAAALGEPFSTNTPLSLAGIALVCLGIFIALSDSLPDEL